MPTIIEVGTVFLDNLGYINAVDRLTQQRAYVTRVTRENIVIPVADMLYSRERVWYGPSISGRVDRYLDHYRIVAAHHDFITFDPRLTVEQLENIVKCVNEETQQRRRVVKDRHEAYADAVFEARAWVITTINHNKHIGE
jgi:protein gp37